MFCVGKLKVAIIGAGAAGLVAARHCLAYNFEFDIFEQTDQVGGTWVYTDHTHVDDFGLPVHSSMYENLETNLPKEVMDYPDFPFPENSRSYLKQDEVLAYLQAYSKHFKIYEKIQFLSRVLCVMPENNKWEVTVEDVKTKYQQRNIYEAVIVCNGHFSEPRFNKIEGQNVFLGAQIHSHTFRKAQTFSGKSVLVIGGGPSGSEIACRLSGIASKVVFSHHRTRFKFKIPDNVKQVPDVKRLTETTAIFENDIEESIDTIIYSTGYYYSFPFLAEECQVTVEDAWVKPLYKHMININFPTMTFIGLNFMYCPFKIFDCQVRFFMQYLNGAFELPSREEMLADLARDMTKRKALGWPKRHAHLLGPFQKAYADEICIMAKTQPIPSVIFDIYDHATANVDRRNCYEIIGDRFTVRKLSVSL